MKPKPVAMDAIPTFPDLPITLCDSILATVPHLSSFHRPPATPTPMRLLPIASALTHKRRHFDALITVLPRAIARSCFCAALLALARSQPWAACSVLTRLAQSSARNKSAIDIKQAIDHLAPVLRLPARFMPVVEFDMEIMIIAMHDDDDDDDDDDDCGGGPGLLTLASVLAMCLGARSCWKMLTYLISRPWMHPDMWSQELLMHLIKTGNVEGLAWWNKQKLPVHDVTVSDAVVLQAVASGHLHAFEWLVQVFPDLYLDPDELIMAGVASGRPKIMDAIWTYLNPEDKFDFGWMDEHWDAASPGHACDMDKNTPILEWARSKGFEFPEPQEMMACIDDAASVKVLDWWLEQYLNTVDKHQVEYSTDSLDSATQSKDLDRLNWWLRSGLELRFSPQAIEAAKGTPRLEEWWNQRVEYKLLSGAISLEAATEVLGFIPCRHWQTLCSWGRLDLLDALDMRPWVEPGPTDLLTMIRGLRAACMFGHVSILDRFLGSASDARIHQSHLHCLTHTAIAHGQIGVLTWLDKHGYMDSFARDLWMTLACRLVQQPASARAADVIEWMCSSGKLALPMDETLVADAVCACSYDCSIKRFPLLHRMWKVGGLGVYSFAVTDKMIRTAVDAGCEEMIQWWLERQEDTLHEVHVELLSEAAEHLEVGGRS